MRLLDGDSDGFDVGYWEGSLVVGDDEGIFEGVRDGES